MSYKSLLFCPDERAARAVTQILSELDFTVELAAEPFAAVKTLADEHFDALVVDCANEQDASLLFKAARNSSHNHSSLSVAVVEGQAGVAKAFRIGANLVLTKPINIEQSKGTLRVARGLLRKGQAKPAPASSQTAVAAGDTSALAAEAPKAKLASPLSSVAPTVPPTLVPIMQSAPKPVVATPPASPFSAFEVEKEAAPAPEAADAAVLDSLHDTIGKAEPKVIVPLGQAEPIAASTAGQAAAAAPALETKATELGTAGAAPMFTNEPIVNEQAAPASEPLEAPTFSSLDATARRESGGGSGFLKIAAILLIVGVGGYFGWQKFQPMQYLHRSSATDSSAGTAAESETAVSAQQAAAPTEQPPQTAVNSTPTPSAPTTQAPVPTISAGDVEKDSHKHPASSDDDGTIELQELPLAPGAKPNFTKVTITPRGAEPAPLQVKSDAGNSEAKSKAAQMQAPSVQIAASNDDAEVANLIAAPVALPKAAPGTVRVSQGVSQGLLLKKVAPIYPPEALRIHKEGIVQLLATVSKSGNISNVRVLGGDPTLAQAAADAVLRWKYRPYLLNGQPVEIETQISVVFKAPH